MDKFDGRGDHGAYLFTKPHACGFDRPPQRNPGQNQQAFSQHLTERAADGFNATAEKQGSRERSQARRQRNPADAASMSVTSLGLLVRKREMGVDG